MGSQQHAGVHKPQFLETADYEQHRIHIQQMQTYCAIPLCLNALCLRF